MRSAPSAPTAASPLRQWSRVAEAFYEVLEDQRPRLVAEAEAFGLEESDLQLPDDPPEKLLRQLQQSNPDLDLQHLPSDPYPLAVAALRLLADLHP